MSPEALSRHMDYARRIVNLLDTKYSLFGVRFGLDPLLNIIPGLGNIFSVVASGYLFWIAVQMKVPAKTYAAMARNVIIDYFLGIIPVAGVGFDLLYRANVKNLRLLEEYIPQAPNTNFRIPNK